MMAIKMKYTPTFKQIMDMSEYDEGFCINCGFVQDGCEPDARGYTCENCEHDTVYGAGELALMGIVSLEDEEDSSNDLE